MDRPENEPTPGEIEKLAHTEDEIALEDLDLPEGLKSELLRELDGFKEGDDGRRRSGSPHRA